MPLLCSHSVFNLLLVERLDGAYLIHLLPCLNELCQSPPLVPTSVINVKGNARLSSVHASIAMMSTQNKAAGFSDQLPTKEPAWSFPP